MIVACPLTIADIFDRTVTLAVQRWRPVVILAILGTIPDAVVGAASHGRDPSGAGLFVSVAGGFVVGAFTWSALIHVFSGDVEVRSIAYLLRRSVPYFWRSLLVFCVIDSLLAAPIVVLLFVVGVGYGIAHLAGAIVAGVVFGIPAVIALPGLYVIVAISYPMVILEQTGVRLSLRNAWRRTRRGGYVRTWLFGSAMLVATFVPVIAIDAGQKHLATVLGGFWWLTLAGSFLTGLIAAGLGLGLATVAAIDYRLRAEGTDLHAALEMPAPA